MANAYTHTHRQTPKASRPWQIIKCKTLGKQKMAPQKCHICTID